VSAADSNRGRHHGRAKYPDCDIAEMRWMHESMKMSAAKIERHFGFTYTESYIIKIIRGELRANIKAEKPKDSQ